MLEPEDDWVRVLERGWAGWWSCVMVFCGATGVGVGAEVGVFEKRPWGENGLSRGAGENRWPSRDMRWRVFEAIGLEACGSELSAWPLVLEKKELDWRCWRVDFLREDDLLGMVEK
jgi:hypothetical protein